MADSSSDNTASTSTSTSGSSSNKLDFTLTELTADSCPHGDEDVRGASSTVELRDSRFVCVEYPAVVRSCSGMLETLGGESTVAKTFANPTRRLELRFRPQDPFCHPVCGNRFSSNNLLLRVRRRVRKKEPKEAEIHMDLLGIIDTTYKFQGMADFQCLAVNMSSGKETSLYDKIILHKSENQAFFEQPMPYFLPPAIFSRLDSPVDYFYRPDSCLNAVVDATNNYISQNRNPRPNNTIFVSFSDAAVPSECLDGARLNWDKICQNEQDRKAEQQIREMFESRPIWSRNAVVANVNIHHAKVKVLLPIFAYYMVTGPWRSLWVRLGYDPRKERDAKKYQMLDFRLRCSTKYGYSPLDAPVKAKRSALNYSLPITLNKTGPQPVSVMGLPGQEGSSQDVSPSPHHLKESSYIFRDGMLPPHRQMFYQLCDLHVDSIQQVVDQISENQEVCYERDGWCDIGTTDRLRDVISGLIKKALRAQKPEPQESSRRTTRIRKGGRPARTGGDEDEDDDEDEDEEEDDGDDEDYHPSEGSENEMETEILEYL